MQIPQHILIALVIEHSELIYFEWTYGNRTKNVLKHQVTRNETEEVFSNLPIIICKDRKHSLSENRYHCFGQTNNRRKLLVVFTTRNNKIRVISARDQDRKERMLYESKI